jgi:hypothetical protein
MFQPTSLSSFTLPQSPSALISSEKDTFITFYTYNDGQRSGAIAKFNANGEQTRMVETNAILDAKQSQNGEEIRTVDANGCICTYNTRNLELKDQMTVQESVAHLNTTESTGQILRTENEYTE